MGAGPTMAELFERRLSRRSLLRAGALAAASPLLLRTARASAGLVPGPTWVAFGDDATSALTISSSLPAEFTNAVLHYGPTTALGADAPLDVSGLPGVATRYGRAQLTSLTPQTTFFYQVEVDGALGPVKQVATAPAVQGTFKFTAFGDEATTASSRSMLSQIRSRKAAFHLVAGDLCYADSSGQGLPTDILKSSVWDSWLGLTSPLAATTPWMTAVGNHEMEPGLGPQGYDGYLTRLAVPGTGPQGCPASYHFRYGSAAFIQVDSNDASYEIPANLNYSAGAQTSWLTDVLTAYRADPTIDFVVVTMHHCAYSTAKEHGSEGGIRDHWVPLFDSYGVDLVLSGHNHVYERTHPLRGSLPVTSAPSGATISSAAGTTYVVVGGGGATLGTGFTPGKTRLSVAGGAKQTVPATFTARTVRDHCYLIGSVVPATTTSQAQLNLTIRNASGVSVDTLHLRRPARTAVIPTQPAPAVPLLIPTAG